MTELMTENWQLADCNHLPIIDLSTLDSPNVNERQKLAQSLCDACTQVGFFYIKVGWFGSYSRESLCAHAACSEPRDSRGQNQWHTLLRQAALRSPRGAKDEVLHWKLPRTPGSLNSQQDMLRLDQKFRGYSPLGGEKSIGTDDAPIAEEDAVSALSEAFDIGYETAMDPQKLKDDPLPLDPYDLYGDNQWPGQEILPNFTETYIEYCAMMLELCRKLMRMFALALGLPEEYFDSMTQNPGVTSRMMHYPPQPLKEEVREGLGAHTVRS